MSVLAIDIGNTRVGFNVFTAGKAQDAAVRLTHAELAAELPGTLRTLWEKAQKETTENGDEETGVVIASVVPALTEKLASAVWDQLKLKADIVGRDLKIPLKTALADESTVGHDRLLAALAAFVNVEGACAIIHAGTALVVDCINSEGVFQGGAIAPGLTMGAKALHDFAAQLPQAALAPPADDAPYGTNTQSAINLGLYAALRGTVRELLERYATALTAWPHVVATGGDAAALPPEIIDSFVPDLVLQGAALAWENART
jgi:type III pantothenate kinase